MRKLFTLLLLLAITVAMTCEAQNRESEKFKTLAQYEFCKKYDANICARQAAGDGGVLVFIGNPQKKTIYGFVYLPKDMQRDDPPAIMNYLIYHNIGKDKEYCGMLCRYYKWEKENGKDKFYKIEKEYRVTDDAANMIIDILSKDHEYKMVGPLNERAAKKDILLEVFTPELTKTTKQEENYNQMLAFASNIDRIDILITRGKWADEKE